MANVHSGVFVKAEKGSSWDFVNMVQWPPGRILGLRPANERRRYFVTTSLNGWAQI